MCTEQREEMDGAEELLYLKDRVLEQCDLVTSSLGANSFLDRLMVEDDFKLPRLAGAINRLQTAMAQYRGAKRSPQRDAGG
jgi:hypothetical protein